MTRIKRALGNKMPSGPEQENQIWYRWLKDTENLPAVEHSHRDFLLLRDYTALSALLLIGFGLASWFIVESVARLLYSLALLAQFVIVRHAAATVGARFVCTVMAHKTSA